MLAYTKRPSKNLIMRQTLFTRFCKGLTLITAHRCISKEDNYIVLLLLSRPKTLVPRIAVNSSIYTYIYLQHDVLETETSSFDFSEIGTNVSTAFCFHQSSLFSRVE